MRRSFTLIEVLTVMAIIGILASLGAYTYAASLTRSRDSQRIADLQLIRNSLEQYYVDNRSYPIFRGLDSQPEATFQLEKLDNTCQPGDKFLAPKYLGQIPQDPSYKFNIGGGCEMYSKGQYLYYGLPKGSSKTGFYLMALMERAQNVNYTTAVGAVLTNPPNNYVASNFCDFGQFTASPTGCFQNYFVTNSINN